MTYNSKDVQMTTYNIKTTVLSLVRFSVHILTQNKQHIS